jgi:hypothetical protein
MSPELPEGWLRRQGCARVCWFGVVITLFLYHANAAALRLQKCELYKQISKKSKLA